MKEEVTFVDVDAFGKTAETIGQYLKKGRPILMEGRLRYETWDDKQTRPETQQTRRCPGKLSVPGFRRRADSTVCRRQLPAAPSRPQPPPLSR